MTTANRPASEGALLVVTEDEKRFKRSNSLTPLRVESGGMLSLLDRKLLNTMAMHTQRQGEPGQNAPPDEPGEDINKDYYWTTLAEFCADVQFNSNDTDYLKKSFANLQSIVLSRETANRLSSTVLLSGYQIVNPLGKRGSRVWVGWEFPSAVREEVKRPEIYNWATLHYLNALNTTAGAALYDIANRYCSSPSRLTMKESPDWWYATLCGVPVSSKVKEYKYFKRDVLLCAIEEINAVTDVTIDLSAGDLIEFREKRRVVAIQFRVARKAQQQLELTGPIINTELMQQIADLGMSMRDAENIFATHPENLIRETLKLVEERLNNPSLPSVSSPAGFFRAALKGKYVDNKPKLTPRHQRKPAELPKEAAPDPAASAARDAALAGFDALDETSRQSLLEEFLTQNSHLMEKARRNSNTPLVRKSLAGWLVARNADG